MTIACAGLVQQARGATYLLDDSATHVMTPNAQMEWRSTAPGRSPDNDVETWVRVNIRIDTRPWIGHSGRVYMVLEQDAGPRLTVEWQTQGRLLDGRLVSGERALVFAGAITQPMLEDWLLLHLRTDGRWMSNSRRLQFHFELTTD